MASESDASQPGPSQPTHSTKRKRLTQTQRIQQGMSPNKKRRQKRQNQLLARLNGDVAELQACCGAEGIVAILPEDTERIAITTTLHCEHLEEEKYTDLERWMPVVIAASKLRRRKNSHSFEKLTTKEKANVITVRSLNGRYKTAELCHTSPDPQLPEQRLNRMQQMIGRHCLTRPSGIGGCGSPTRPALVLCPSSSGTSIAGTLRYHIASPGS